MATSQKSKGALRAARCRAKKLASGLKLFQHYVKPEWWKVLNDLLEKLKIEDQK